MDGQKKRKGGAEGERERIKRREALAADAAKCCKISDMFVSKGPEEFSINTAKESCAYLKKPGWN